MPKAVSTTYAGGMLSKGLWGRVDLNKYQTGFKEGKNFTVAVEGGVEKRFGLYYTGKRKVQNKASRLIGWRISNDDSYMLEFGDLYIRFIRFGGYVAIPGGHVALPGNMAANVSGVMELTTPWTADQLRQLKFTFANDQMFINHPSVPEQVISRLGLYDWKIAPQNFTPHPTGPVITSLVFNNTTTAGDAYVAEPVPTSYRVSATLADGTETLASPIATVNADTGHRRCWVSMSWSAVAGAIQYTIYKGKNGIFGFIGYVDAPTTSYSDRNYAPSFDVVPLGKRLEFPAGEYPRVSEFYKQRKAYGASTTQPQTLRISKPLVFNSLYTSIPSLDDDAIELTLVGRERHTINHMVELKKFLIFTDSAEWVLGTSGNGGLSPSSADPTIETNYGADPDLRPLPIGDRILFIQGITGMILDMGYEYTSDSFKADELSRLSRDLFKNKEITAWDYAKYPGNLLPVVMSDGTANMMTYVREHEVWGWSWLETEGEIIDVGCVPEVNETGIYFQVRRKLNGVDVYTIERMQYNYNERIEDMFYVDCGLTYTSSLPYTNLVRVSDTQVTLTVAGQGYVVGKELQIEDGSLDKEGLPTFFRAEITAVAGDNLTLKPLRVSKFPVTIAATGTSYLCTKVVTGLDHLNGTPVWVLADGKVQKDDMVVGGSLTLDFTACRIHVGLPYEAHFETLDLDAQGGDGQYNMRAIDEIIIRLKNSRGVWAGASTSPRDLEVIQGRNLENMYLANDALEGPYRVPTHVAWEMTAGVRVESRDPLPCNILNIVPEIIYGN